MLNLSDSLAQAPWRSFLRGSHFDASQLALWPEVTSSLHPRQQRLGSSEPFAQENRIFSPSSSSSSFFFWFSPAASACAVGVASRCLVRTGGLRIVHVDPQQEALRPGDLDLEKARPTDGDRLEPRAWGKKTSEKPWAPAGCGGQNRSRSHILVGRGEFTTHFNTHLLGVF